MPILLRGILGQISCVHESIMWRSLSQKFNMDTVNIQKAIEHGPVEIVDLPSYKMVDLSIFSIVMWQFTGGYFWNSGTSNCFLGVSPVFQRHPIHPHDAARVEAAKVRLHTWCFFESQPSIGTNYDSIRNTMYYYTVLKSRHCIHHSNIHIWKTCSSGISWYHLIKLLQYSAIMTCLLYTQSMFLGKL
jgi:hypothetical protein